MVQPAMNLPEGTTDGQERRARPGFWAALVWALGLLLVACRPLPVTSQPSTQSIPGNLDRPTPTSVSQTKGPVFDSICLQLLDKTYVSVVSRVLGDTAEGPLIGPGMVSFLSDGRVIWRYGLQPVFGAFECSAGEIMASFAEGLYKGFTAHFDPQTGSLMVEDEEYVEASEP